MPLVLFEDQWFLLRGKHSCYCALFGHPFVLSPLSGCAITIVETFISFCTGFLIHVTLYPTWNSLRCFRICGVSIDLVASSGTSFTPL